MQALQNDADMIEAYVSLGTALRRLGRYQEALDLHAIALRRDPESLENFEGWADALMHLNMLGNAVASYTKYSEEGSPRAQVLMDAIKVWLVEMSEDPGELDPAHVEKMAAWVAEQEQGG
jgi:tetratricopeptide (TPR) repeat protein